MGVPGGTRSASVKVVSAPFLTLVAATKAFCGRPAASNSSRNSSPWCGEPGMLTMTVSPAFMSLIVFGGGGVALVCVCTVGTGGGCVLGGTTAFTNLGFLVKVVPLMPVIVLSCLITSTFLPTLKLVTVPYTSRWPL